MPLALGIETSCDDTSVSLVKFTGEVLFHVTQGQTKVHSPYGGIVPELASRNHSEQLLPLIEQALLKVSLDEIDVIACTNRPGLMGALLVGSITGQTLGLFWNKPVVGVNHIEGHIFSPFLSSASHPAPKEPPVFPFLALIVSGSHTHLYLVNDFGKSRLLGATRDDAAGEALDKFGKMLGFNWPGGPYIDRWAAKATGRADYFPKIQTPYLSFSFSGLKSAGNRFLKEKSTEWIKKNLPLLCAGYQEAVVNHLMEKIDLAFQEFPVQRLIVGGGVSANSLLRERLSKWSEKSKVQILLPEKSYCTDNAAMIGYTGLHHFLKKKSHIFPFVCSPCHLEQDFFRP